MSKRLILILALAFVVGLSAYAYAEVQNVKVSGDITVKGVSRNNFDLTKTSQMGSVTGSVRFDDKDRDILSITRVRVDADLTDNVSATVRLLNERVWNGDGNAAGSANRNIGLNTAPASNADENDIDLDLAYVTLKEFLYSPLSLMVGRQELHFGNELIVGDPDTNIYSSVTELAEGDLSVRKSFDAIRATLDYNPLVVDLLYAKVEEGASNLNDDVTLSGVNASYALNKNTTLEGFLFNKVKGANAAAVWNVDSGSATGFFGQNIKEGSDIVNTIGLRAVDKTVSNLNLDAQVAYQFGTYNPKFDPNAKWISNTNKAETSKRSAWAAQVMAAYNLKDIGYISKYSPSLHGSYTYLSGADRSKTGNKAYKGWDPMFENQTIGHIMNAIFADTNMHKVALGANAKVTDDLSVGLDYVQAMFAKKVAAGTKFDASGIATSSATARQFISKDGKSYIGQELDATLTYDYTEDVQFSLLGGIFFPGKTIQNSTTGSTSDQRAAATELIGSMKVTF